MKTLSQLKPTGEQLTAIELCGKSPTDNIKINALAGTGKTTTIALIAAALTKDNNKKGIYLSFNKAICQDAQKKLPKSVTAKTFHSLAYNSTPRWLTAKLMKGIPLYTLSFLEWSGINDTTVVMGDDSKKQVNGDAAAEHEVTPSKKFMIIKKALDFFCRGDATKPNINHIKWAADYILDTSLYEESAQALGLGLYPHLQRTWEDMCSPTGSLQISHDVYLKYYALDEPVIDYDFILFDEAQDADHLMLSILQQQETKIIFVGDAYQQIYEWRGAKNAMTLFQGEETSLTNSFRFGSHIALLANCILKELQCPHQLLGSSPTPDQVIYKDYLTKDVNAILCRTNAGAIQTAIDSLDENPDRDIHLEFNTTPSSILELLEEIERLSSGEKSKHPVLKNFANDMELEDYCQNFPNDERISGIYRLYKEHGKAYLSELFFKLGIKKKITDKTLIITTVHKSKGREWEAVALADDFLGKSFSYQKKFDGYYFCSDAEARLLYVAATRAKSRLYAVHILKLLEDLTGQELGLVGSDKKDRSDSALIADKDSLELSDQFLFEYPNKQGGQDGLLEGATEPTGEAESFADSFAKALRNS